MVGTAQTVKNHPLKSLRYVDLLGINSDIKCYVEFKIRSEIRRLYFVVLNDLR